VGGSVNRRDAAARGAAPGAPLEPAFSGMALDRAGSLRTDPAWVAEVLERSTTRVLGASHEGVLVEDASEPALARRRLGRLRDGGANDAEPLLLGLEHGSALFAVDLDALDSGARAAFARGGRAIGMRDAGAVLSRSEAGLAAYLMALLNWHRRHRFCANCGAATTVGEAGYTRSCPGCEALHFPRTDPVVIMTVEHAGSVLLGRRAEWPARQYSALAGFVSPGESLAEAVVREVREEAGIEVHDPTFVTSQPWPFPSSLMLGFHALSDGGDPMPVDGELEDVRWFPLDEVRAAIATDDTELRLPPTISIARFLLERWAATAARAS
jgi:NAD+ diphosphatase